MVSLLDLAPITDSNNETLQEHLDEINISHNDLQTVELLDSQKIIMMQYWMKISAMYQLWMNQFLIIQPDWGDRHLD